MDGRTVDVILQHFDGRFAAKLTVHFPPPAALAYGGQLWRHTGGFGSRDVVYRPERPFVRPAPREERLIVEPFRRRS